MMSETANPHLVHTERLTAEAERVATLLDGLGTDDWLRTIPACPGWTVRKAARHLGTAHRWAAAIVRSPQSEAVNPRTLDLGLPESYADYGDWIRTGAAELADAVRESGPDKPVWSWGTDPHARFWARRMLHETAVHRGDMELALGRTPKYDPAVAADGIDEFLSVLPAAAAFAPKIRALTGDGETLHLHATDGDPRGGRRGARRVADHPGAARLPLAPRARQGRRRGPRAGRRAVPVHLGPARAGRRGDRGAGRPHPAGPLDHERLVLSRRPRPLRRPRHRGRRHAASTSLAGPDRPGPRPAVNEGRSRGIFTAATHPGALPSAHDD